MPENVSAVERYQQTQHARDAALTTADALSKRIDAAKSSNTASDWPKIAGLTLQVEHERARAASLDAELPALHISASAELAAQHLATLAQLQAELGRQIEAAAQALAPALVEAQRAVQRAGADALAQGRSLPTELLVRDDRQDFGPALINLRQLCERVTGTVIGRAMTIANITRGTQQ